MDYYGYSSERAWDVKLEPWGSRLVKKRQRASVLRLAEEEAIQYLLTRPAAIFKSTKGDGSCGFRAVWQASQHAAVPILDKMGAPEKVNHADDAGRLERMR